MVGATVIRVVYREIDAVADAWSIFNLPTMFP